MNMPALVSWFKGGGERALQSLSRAFGIVEKAIGDRATNAELRRRMDAWTRSLRDLQNVHALEAQVLGCKGDLLSNLAQLVNRANQATSQRHPELVRLDNMLWQECVRLRRGR